MRKLEVRQSSGLSKSRAPRSGVQAMRQKLASMIEEVQA